MLQHQSRPGQCNLPLLFFLASALGLQIGLIVAVILVLGLGAALVTYFYRRR